MESKKQEQDFQFSVWLIASIFLHILLIIVILFWFLQTSLQQLFTRRAPREVQKQLSEKQLLQLKKEEARKNAVQWKDLKKPEEKEPIQHTLIPGRQAITEATSTEKQSEQKKESIAKSKEAKAQEQKAAEPKQQPKEVKQEPIQQKNLTKEFPQEMPKEKHSKGIVQEKIKSQKNVSKKIDQSIFQQVPPKTTEERHDDLKERLLKEAKLKAEQQLQEAKDQIAIAESQASQKTNSNNPTIVKNKITLKDLQLGFSKFMQEGNNDILLQKGNTNQPPDAQALRLITYQQQFACTMREAIVTHHQYHLVQHLRGARPTYNITIDRSGKLLDFQLMASSGNELLDKIIKEALQTVRLYPAMPQHLVGDTFSHAWTFLH